MKTRLFVWAMVCAFALGCYPTSTFDLDEDFTLAYGATKRNLTENLRIRFDKVLRDERCPIEHNCLLPGNAQVQLTFWSGNRKQVLALNTWDEPRATVLFGYMVRLEGLAPPRSLTTPIAPKDYEVRVRVGAAEGDCLQNSDCQGATESGRFCQKEAESCDAVGRCAAMPDVCPQVVDPVCGCDHKTYGNSCLAAAAGVNVAYKGSCRPQNCWSNKECSAGEYCFFKDCTQETGQCQPRPEACTMIYDPVCGCDGQTYSSACVAASMGVSVDYKGECELPRDTRCDDGTEPTCRMPAPVCAEFEILAYQANCYACVNPISCKPWGTPGCTPDNGACGSSGVCDPCATSSCPACEDCVAACIP